MQNEGTHDNNSSNSESRFPMTGIFPPVPAGIKLTAT